MRSEGKKLDAKWRKVDATTKNMKFQHFIACIFEKECQIMKTVYKFIPTISIYSSKQMFSEVECLQNLSKQTSNILNMLRI